MMSIGSNSCLGGSGFIVLEVDGAETRADNHTESVSLDGAVGLDASTTVISTRKVNLDGRKLAGSFARKGGYRG